MECIKKIKYGKEEIGLRFSMLTLKKFCEIEKCEFFEIDKRMAERPDSALISLVSSAHDVYTEGAPILSNEYKVDAFIQEISADEYSEIMEGYYSSIQEYIDKMSNAKKKKKNQSQSHGK